MADIGSINNQTITGNQALYQLSAQQAAAQQAAQQAKKSEKTTKSSFSSIFKKTQESNLLASEGLPPEIAGMETEEAVKFLKDEMDLAGDQLKTFQSLENLEKYKKKVSSFMKYIVKNNFRINKEVLSERMKMRLTRKGRPVDPKIQVQIIDQRINQLASDMLIIHGKNLNLLARLEEINGMIIDLLAA